MSCPICQYSHLKSEDTACPQCGTAMSTLESIVNLRYAQRKERGEKVAMAMLVGVLFLFSTIMVYLHDVDIQKMKASKANVKQISSDSLRALNYTLAEQQKELESLQAKLLELTPPPVEAQNEGASSLKTGK